MREEFWQAELMENVDLKDLGVDGTTVLNQIFNSKWGGRELNVAQDRDNCLALVSTVITTRLSLNTENSLSS